MFYQDITHRHLCQCSSVEVDRNSPFPPHSQTSTQSPDPSTEIRDTWNKHLPCLIPHAGGWAHLWASIQPPLRPKLLLLRLSQPTSGPPGIEANHRSVSSGGFRLSEVKGVARLLCDTMKCVLATLFRFFMSCEHRPL